MRIAEFETVTPPVLQTDLPMTLEQKAPTLGPAMLLALMMPLALLLLFPLAAIALNIAIDPAARTNLAANPALAVQIVAGLGLASLLIVWPIRALFDRIGRKRVVLIDRQVVLVSDRSLFGTRTWHQPLAAYAGLAHHVRTTHAGVRHELILIHENRDASVLLGITPCVTDSDLAALANRLGVPVVSPKTMYATAWLPAWSSLRRAPHTPLSSLEA